MVGVHFPQSCHTPLSPLRSPLSSVYDANGILECQEPVPFRLTRNIHSFFNPLTTFGVFLAAFCATAQAISSPQVLTWVV